MKLRLTTPAKHGKPSVEFELREMRTWVAVICLSVAPAGSVPGRPRQRLPGGIPDGGVEGVARRYRIWFAAHCPDARVCDEHLWALFRFMAEHPDAWFSLDAGEKEIK